ncbi:MAG TPA: helix-turn-helix transcriptional regulator [Oscillospiraceae bacterium]|nr:helix-turn-helix transcriptional regulator [Oscillospiraceae bacterium]HRW57803.1 helix-turn-helix transcriptional regulator [Oscillospiraceae bacterium]
MKYPNIEAERARRNLSYESMAERLGVTRKTLYNWIVSGKIPQNKIEDMADYFGCSVDYLLSHEITFKNAIKEDVRA